jgi:hypothetical protein
VERLRTNGGEDGPVERLKRAAADADSLKRRIEAALKHEAAHVLREPTRRPH